MKMVDVIELSRGLCRMPIEGKMAYAGRENFLGRVASGYEGVVDFLLTPETANRLCLVQNGLIREGLGLFIFDAYRPLSAVKDFVAWAALPPASEYELERKRIHYPHVEKADFTKLGYIADKVSTHCYGTAVDLTLIDLATKELLDMGTVFDYFGKESHLDAEVGVENRQKLLRAMEKFNFIPYEFEWWHFDSV